MITSHYFISDTAYQTYFNGYDFGAYSPNIVTVNGKKYISKADWDLWIISKANHDYIINIAPESDMSSFIDNTFLSLNQTEYEAHKTDLSTDHAAFIDKEWELCEIVLKEMGTELQKQIKEGTLTQLQGLQLQELFSKQTPLAFTSLGGLQLSIPITEYLGQNKSLGAAQLRLNETPIDTSIGFTQALKDHFLSIIQKQITALNA